METSTKKHLSPTVWYLLVGQWISWPGLLASAQAWPQWRFGVTSSPLSLAILHDLAVGTLLTSAWGVLYQFVPIAFQAPPLPRHVLAWHLPLQVFGALWLSAGFAAGQWPWVAAGGALVTVAGAGLFALVLRSYLRARNKTVVHRALLVPLGLLWLVLLLGLVQALWPQAMRSPVVHTHALLAGFGWWGALVLALTYKLLPMFAVSPLHGTTPRRTLSLYCGGLVAWLAGMWSGAGQQAAGLGTNGGHVTSALPVLLNWLGAALFLAALVWFVRDMVRIMQASKRQRQVWPVTAALWASGGLTAGQVGVLAGVVAARPQLVAGAAWCMLFAGLLPLVQAYAQKIVPFLWFEYRFSKRPERKTAPLIDDMVPARQARWVWRLHWLGVAAGLAVWLCPTDARGWVQALGLLSALLLFAASLLLSRALVHVLSIGGPRPAEDPPT
ncbi:MAG: hypothetical protein K6T31_01770 [Alicyclobacillus sp.]|nr:hypothetical protein [Alicyclobacillus sp.]